MKYFLSFFILFKLILIYCLIWKLGNWLYLASQMHNNFIQENYCSFFIFLFLLRWVSVQCVCVVPASADSSVTPVDSRWQWWQHNQCQAISKLLVARNGLLLHINEFKLNRSLEQIHGYVKRNRRNGIVTIIKFSLVTETKNRAGSSHATSFQIE